MTYAEMDARLSTQEKLNAQHRDRMTKDRETQQALIDQINAQLEALNALLRPGKA